MKKLMLFLMVIAFLTWGCSHSYNAMMASGVSLQSNTNYELLGDTQGTASVTEILCLFQVGDIYTHGTMGGTSLLNPFNAKEMCESAAMYKAIQNFEGADQIICPRFKTEMQNSGIFVTYTSTVTAKAIKIKK
jgi:hypothetical protein